MIPSVTVTPFYITVHFATNLECLHGLINNVIKIDEGTRSLLMGLLEEKTIDYCSLSSARRLT